MIGKNPFWKQGVELGRKHNQEFVQIPHARFIEMLTYTNVFACQEALPRRQADHALSLDHLC